MRDSIFRGNWGPGLWMDESVYNMWITGSEFRNNDGHGTSLELSSTAVFANNIVTNNGGFGIKVNDISNVRIWNNTFTGNDRSINIVQDSRRPTSASSVGRDPRQPFPDPTMTWLNGPVTVANNIIANPRSGDCLLCVEDYSGQRSAEQMGITANGNIYNRPNAARPGWIAVWSNGPGDPDVFDTLNEFRAGAQQEASGQLIEGGAIVDTNGNLNYVPTNTALALPSDIATAIGRTAGTKYHGAFPR